MLTPVEMQGRELKTGRGYQKKEADEFLHEIFRDYESLYRENMELKDKINVLSDGLKYYKDLEKTLQKTLVVAEKAAEETTNASKKKAEGIEQKARLMADAMVNEAKKEADRIYSSVKALSQQYESYRIQCRQLATAHLEMLDSSAYKVDMEVKPMLYEELDFGSSFKPLEKGIEQLPPGKMAEPSKSEALEMKAPVSADEQMEQEERKRRKAEKLEQLSKELDESEQRKKLQKEIQQQEPLRKEQKELEQSEQVQKEQKEIEQLEQVQKEQKEVEQSEQLSEEQKELEQLEMLRREYRELERQEKLRKEKAEQQKEHKKQQEKKKSTSQDILWDEEESFDNDLFEFLNLNDDE